MAGSLQYVYRHRIVKDSFSCSITSSNIPTRVLRRSMRVARMLRRSKVRARRSLPLSL